MEEHKVDQGNPFLSPIRLLQLLSGQLELSTFPLWRCAICTRLWQFKLSLGPFQSLQRMLHYCTWDLPLAWNDLYTPNLEYHIKLKMEILKNRTLCSHWIFLWSLKKFHDLNLNSLAFLSLKKPTIKFQVFHDVWQPGLCIDPESYIEISFSFIVSFILVILNPCNVGSTPTPTGIQILLTVLYKIGINIVPRLATSTCGI